MRVLAALDEGLSKTKVHQQFKVSRSTVDDWLKLRTETGKVEATSDYRRGPAPRVGGQLRASRLYRPTPAQYLEPAS